MIEWNTIVVYSIVSLPGVDLRFPSSGWGVTKTIGGPMATYSSAKFSLKTAWNEEPLASLKCYYVDPPLFDTMNI